MANRLDTMEGHMQLISAHVGLDAVSFEANKLQPEVLPKSGVQASGARQDTAVSASLMQQLRDMRAELSQLQQAQASAQAHTSPMASTELAELQRQSENQSSQVQQLHRLAAEWKQDSAVLQDSTAAQGRAIAQMQQSHQDLSLQVSTVSGDMHRQGNELQGAIRSVEEHHAVAHAQLSQELSRHHEDLGKLTPSSVLHDEQLQQHAAMLAKHEERLASSARFGAEAQAASQNPQETAGSVSSTTYATGVLPVVCSSVLACSATHIFPAEFPLKYDACSRCSYSAHRLMIISCSCIHSSRRYIRQVASSSCCYAHKTCIPNLMCSASACGWRLLWCT